MKTVRALIGLTILFAAAACARPSKVETRLEAIQRRGTLGCGVDPAVPGFSQVDADGRYRGLDVDICRALAAAILGAPDKVTFVRATSVDDFRKNDAIDVVSRRITWELRREIPFGLLFGPVTFYDGQGFLVARSLGVRELRDLADREICVAGVPFDTNLTAYFAAHELKLNRVLLPDPHDLEAVAAALDAGRCRAYSADVSLLGAVRSRLAKPGGFDILSTQISREPLAQIVRQDDATLFTVLRWTIFALVNAEELGVTSANVDRMRTSTNPDIQRLLGVTPGNGSALSLSEDWAYRTIKALGNYGEIFEKNVGRESPLGLDRGLNRLSTDGGLMYAPPLR